ncbi:MAG TPA: patatin-like phospholipase family protein [Casimicrobiaceae bacterium]|nr:patatin-like phospholipase family protein [Casimicrobiaceae bacterium]
MQCASRRSTDLARPIRAAAALGLAAILCGACATRPVNPPITQVDPRTGYRFVLRAQHFRDRQNLVILAFSGGGTRAAAFSYGVLEALRPMEIIGPKGGRIHMLDEVDMVTGVSGGSFTALAYGLYGEKLFDIYETAFLKRDVQGELIGRVLSPVNWGAWSRSEVAAQLYDDILFHGATFADLGRGDGPFISATATDISSGARVGFHQGIFDILCSDLDRVRLSRAAAASSAVPFALAPVTFNNYGGTCHYTLPPELAVFSDPETAPRPAARVLAHLQDLRSFEDSVHRPYIHLVDGGLSDNLGMRGVLEGLEDLEALNALGRPTPLDDVRRIIMFIVNSRSSPKTTWDESEHPPNAVELLIKATGVPIDHYSYDTVETVRDIVARWQTMRRLRESAAFAANRDPAVAALMRTPNVDLYVIDVSFDALDDPAERNYLNDLPTSFVLPPEAVDRLRAAAAKIIHDSPDFKRLLKDAGARVVERPVGSAPPAAH